MRITQHGTYLTQLTKFPRIFPVNCYLVREDEGLTLIDSAIPGCGPAIIEAARRLGLPIRRIVLTHAHADHIGAADELCRLLPEAELLVSARDARFLNGDMSLDPGEPATKLRGGYQAIKSKPSRLLNDGDRLGSLLVVHTPGHTPGHIALFDTRDHTLIAGDAFQTRAGLAVSGTVRFWFPFPAMATWNRPLALESARRLLALEPARLAVGHGEVLEQPQPAIEQAIGVTASELGELQQHGA